MKHRFIITFLIIAAICLLGCTVLPVRALPDELPAATATMGSAASPVIITEVQTGQVTASDEFIELYNQSDQPVRLDGWQVRSMNASASAATTTLLTTLGTAVIPGHGYFVLHTPSVPLASGVSGQEYRAGLSGTDKALGLFAPDLAACQVRVQDAVAWGRSTYGEGASIVAVASTHKFMYRYVDVAGTFVDTDNNSEDFGMADAAASVSASPGTVNTRRIAETQIPTGLGKPSSLPGTAIKGCGSKPPDSSPATPAPQTPPPAPAASEPPSVIERPEQAPSPEAAGPVMPARNNGLFAPQISELLPNPAKPQTDAKDEYIELYNPNAAPFELSGFMLEAGAAAKTRKRYTFPADTLLPAKSFKAFYAPETHVALANTQGQVWLLDPFERVVGQTDAYAAAKDGQAWVYAAAKWQWTVAPTPDKLNIIKAPAETKKKTTAASKASAAQSGTVKAATTTGSASSGQPTDLPEDKTAVSDEGGFSPLHPAVLAITGVIAVLYALYEYRRDLANKYYQFRRNRAARREARRSLQGRGGDRADQ
jgi:hypothetical protein